MVLSGCGMLFHLPAAVSAGWFMVLSGCWMAFHLPVAVSADWYYGSVWLWDDIPPSCCWICCLVVEWFPTYLLLYLLGGLWFCLVVGWFSTCLMLYLLAGRWVLSGGGMLFHLPAAVSAGW
jgi:hypothetical protein